MAKKYFVLELPLVAHFFICVIFLCILQMLPSKPVVAIALDTNIHIICRGEKRGAVVGR
jgi:hypothetical protein